MNSFEFIGYKTTPEDQYMLGIATVRVYGKVILKYKHIRGKEGKGDFFVAANHSYTEDGEKKFVSGFMLDSRAEEEVLNDFVRAHAKPSSISKKPGEITYPLPSTPQTKPMEGQQNELPF